MAYKDKDKQREAQRERTRRYRARQKGVTSEGVTSQGVTPTAISKDIIDKVVANFSVKANLPACVPEPVRNRYALGEPEYIQAIDCLLDYTIDELKAKSVWIPVWRYTAGHSLPCSGLKAGKGYPRAGKGQAPETGTGGGVLGSGMG